MALQMKDPILLKHEQARRLVWQKSNSDETRVVKIVTGEPDIFKHDSELFPTLKSFMILRKQLVVLVWPQGQGLEGFRKFLSGYSPEEIQIFAKAIETGTLAIYLATGRPKYHFAILDRRDLFIQKLHKEGASLQQKPWYYLEGDIFDATDYDKYFDNLCRESTRVTAKDVTGGTLN